MRKFLALALMLAGATAANAQSCEFSSEGVPLITNVTYRAWTVFPKLDQNRALNNIARAFAADNAMNVRVDKNLGTVSAQQAPITGGTPFPLRATIRRVQGGVRVDYIATLWPGQITSEDSARSEMCKKIAAASN